MRAIFIKNKKLNVKFMSVVLLVCTYAFLSGCHFNGKVNESSNVNIELQTEKPTEAIAEAKTDVATRVDTEKDGIATDEENEAEVTVSLSDNQGEIVALEVNKDIDGNGVMDAAQIIERNGGSERFIRIYINGEQIFEYVEANIRMLGIEAFEYLDLDGDSINEIFVTSDTNANCRPLIEVFCLKQTDGQWNRMDIPLNETGNNGFSFNITRGKDEFDFIISSDDIEQDINFDARLFFVDDETGNIDSIQAYRSNNYKEGDEVGFISAWGIWEARIGTYEGRNCIIALQGIEGPYGHGLGQINIYFAYNEQGKVEIMNVEYQP